LRETGENQYLRKGGNAFLLSGRGCWTLGGEAGNDGGTPFGRNQKGGEGEKIGEKKGGGAWGYRNHRGGKTDQLSNRGRDLAGGCDLRLLWG